ncbi:MAG TPA: type II toxin-antitoxin system VapC family toxin [Polyangiaceae bacterium]
MKFLLDTNVVSEMRKGKRMQASVAKWLASLDGEELFLSVLVVGELRQGIEQLRLRDPASATRLDRWLRALTDEYADRILPVDLAVAEKWGELNVPKTLPAVDGMLAATVIVHDMTLVTRNVRDMARSGAKLVNPFDG